jgi:hypothetical protein
MTTELTVPKGHGLVRVAHNLRHRVQAHDWQSTPGTDFWFQAGAQDMFTASGATNTSGLDSFGWTTTSLDAFTNAVTADFMSSADDTPPHILANASGDVLGSPKIFGSYSHALQAGQFLGYMPTRLCIEMYAAFTVATANESATNIGLHNGSALVASIYSNTDNFVLSNGTATDVGAAVDNAFHQWKIVVDSATSLQEWFIDGTSQGTVAIKADVWPVSFICTTSTTNRWGISWAHLWYE